MNLSEYLDKNNLHHAYLIEGARDKVVPEVKKFLKSLDINTIGNPDFIYIQLDSFKMEDARNLKSYAAQKSFSSAKKIFIISANNFLPEAQNSLLKIFEGPIGNTTFFLIVPDINTLLKTLISRFYLIFARQEMAEIKNAEEFITMPLKNRIDFIKELLIAPEEEDEDGNEIIALNSSRSKALKFLNELESSLRQKAMSKRLFDVKTFQHLFKVREFLRMPGSSVKTLIESVALVIPSF